MGVREAAQQVEVPEEVEDVEVQLRGVGSYRVITFQRVRGWGVGVLEIELMWFIL